MALYLDNQTRPVLKRLLQKRLLDYPKDFVSERLLKAVEADENRLQEISICEHESAKYTGKKTCCAKCGSFYGPGMGFSWNKTG